MTDEKWMRRYRVLEGFAEIALERLIQHLPRSAPGMFHCDFCARTRPVRRHEDFCPVLDVLPLLKDRTKRPYDKTL